MTRKPSDTQAIGLHLDGLLLKLVEVETVRGKIKVKRLEEFPLHETHDKLAFDHEGEDRICHDLCDKKLTVASLDGKETLIRKMKIKLLRDKDIDEAFKFEAEAHLPYPIEEGIVDKITVAKEEDQTHLTLLSCKKEALSQYLNKFHTLKLDPEAVTCTPAALAAFTARYTHVEGDLMVVYLGEGSSLSAIVHNGKLLSSHSLALGISSLRRAYEEDNQHSTSFENLDFTIEATNHLKAALEKFKHEISWMILSELKALKLENVPLIVLGEGANLKGLETLLFKEIPCQKIELDTHDGIELNQSLLKKFAIAIGAGLSALPKHADPINFRQEELSFPEPWKRFKPSLFIYGAASFILAFLIFLLGQAYLGYQEDHLREKYAETLAEMGKSHQEFEKSLKIEPAPLKDLSLEAIEMRLSTLEKNLKNQPDLFPLLPQVPRVSDVLTWLSNHPQMKSEEGAIKIENFKYQMLKRPEMSKKGEKYQVKVDLEIVAPTPKMARELHTALITPNDFVDPKAEVKWAASRGKYQTSFYLKDKTQYLPGGSK